MMKNEMIIKCDALVKRYRKMNALDGLSLSLPKGSFYGLLGPNGAGKTTCLKTCLGIIRQDSGETEVLGTPSGELGMTHFQRIGYVSENQKTPDWMTAKRYLAYSRNMYPTWDDAFCESLCDQMRFPMDNPLKRCSRGQRMQVLLVAALAYRPELIILDEPFSGLDPLVRDDLIQGLLSAASESNWSVIISSHDIDDVERLVDHVGIINEGRMLVESSLEQLQQETVKVDVHLNEAIASLPVGMPSTWIRAEYSDRRLCFVDTQYEAAKCKERLQQLGLGVSDIMVQSLSLKEIYIAHAREQKQLLNA